VATSTLTKARQNKADEFYTQLPDIEAEMRHYRDQFKGKSVLCNCDDPFESNFFKYFALNFNFLGLRKLVATCYAGSSVMQGELDLFGVPGVAESDARAKTPYKIEITEVPDAYPRYANYDAIEVSKTSEIPCDFDGAMGVPITFLDKYNPEQFEIVGASRFLGRPMSEIAPKGTFVAGGVRFYLPNGDGTYRRLYDRIVIRRKGSAT